MLNLFFHNSLEVYVVQDRVLRIELRFIVGNFLYQRVYFRSTFCYIKGLEIVCNPGRGTAQKPLIYWETLLKNRSFRSKKSHAQVAETFL